ncbi:MAG: histidinol-phosphate transaminase [Propionibacteriales bacterium]|nr:histidinol-phosphate transaminase [Propionibacteriales bacterium]
MVVQLRSAISGLPVYKAGKPAPPGPNGVSYKLSSNENPYPPLPGVLDAAVAAAEQMNRYPDAGNSMITSAVAELLHVDEDQLSFGTGSVAVLYQLLQAICESGDEVVYAWRSFEAYPIAVLATGATAVPVDLGPGATHDLDAMRDAITSATKVVLLCTPNNPTGPAISHTDLIAFIDQVPERVLVVVDEAYVEFVADENAARGLDALHGRENVAVLRTFSKAYGLAGLRVGFCVTHPSLAAGVRAVSVPFGLSVAAQAAAVASLEARDALGERVRALIDERTRLLAGLAELELGVTDSQANFVWLPARENTQLWADEFSRNGLMTRPYIAGDQNDGIRITIGEPEANALVLKVAATFG